MMLSTDGGVPPMAPQPVLTGGAGCFWAVY
jgi:hypothetical protein